MPQFPFPFFRLEVSKTGNLVDPTQVTSIQQALRTAPSITDLAVMSHGWNNDETEAEDLYRAFFQQVDSVLQRHPDAGLHPDRLAVVGVFWPSKKFADSDLIPGGAAGLGDLEDEADDAIDRTIDQLQQLIDEDAASDALESLRSQKNRLDDAAVQDRWMETLKRVLPALAPKNEDEVEGADQFLQATGRESFHRLNRPLVDFQPPLTHDGGGAASFEAVRPPNAESGEAAGLGDLLGGFKGAALNLMNFTTYYVMKERAGAVGHGAVNEALAAIQVGSPIRIHVIGHSFGCRVVTAATQGPRPLRIGSVTLLQAAFSHFGFSDRYDENPAHHGFFRDALPHIGGPIVISHTRQDKAVGKAYAIASRIAGQIASELGDANDPYGGLGRNGAQKTPEKSDLVLLPEGGSYSFQAGHIYNLNGDDIIKGHGDVTGPELAWAFLCAAKA